MNYKMNILIIKNDGFGDLVIIKDLLKKINKKNFNIDIILSKHNEIFFNELKNIKNKFVFDKFGSNFDFNEIISSKDISKLKKLKKKQYDLCIVLRRYLNTEQVAIINKINTKKLTLCHQFFNSKIELKKKFLQVNVPKKYINDYDYFYYFLKKIYLINHPIKKKIFKNFKEKNYIIINLSGEKQFKNFDNISILLKTIANNCKEKIYIIGKTLDKQINYKIEKKLSNIGDVNFINLWSKTNFKNSMRIIRDCKYYIGFDTGLSHYACMINKKSLIILNSGGANKWFPHSKNIINNASYWIYNTPCAGCNHSGNLNKCYFEDRFCVDNIFLNKKKINDNFKNFLRVNSNKFINYSTNDFISTDWNNSYKSIEFKIIDKKGNLINSSSLLHNFYKILKNFVLLINEKINVFLATKLLVKNFRHLLYRVIRW